MSWPPARPLAAPGLGRRQSRYHHRASLHQVVPGTIACADPRAGDPGRHRDHHRIAPVSTVATGLPRSRRPRHCPSPAPPAPRRARRLPHRRPSPPRHFPDRRRRCRLVAPRQRPDRRDRAASWCASAAPPPDVKPSDSPANPHRSGLATLCRPKGCNTRPPKLTSTPRSRAAGSARPQARRADWPGHRRRGHRR